MPTSDDFVDLNVLINVAGVRIYWRVWSCCGESSHEIRHVCHR